MKDNDFADNIDLLENLQSLKQSWNQPPLLYFFPSKYSYIFIRLFNKTHKTTPSNNNLKIFNTNYYELIANIKS